ncbi:MAG: hypothetical protein AAGU11_18865 [Syntrophobacteraceae bacterium]
MDSKPRQLTIEMSKRGLTALRAGSLRVKESVNEALRVALNNCGIDREKVARELSRLTGEEISIHTLNNWCAEGANNRRFPLECAAALSVITNDKGILDAALKIAGFRVLDRGQAAYYELGVLVAEERSRRKRKKEVIDRIGL